MNVFDLHCDTATACCDRGLSLRQNKELHISLEQGRGFQKWYQCFAVWIPDELRGEEAFRYFQKTADYLEKEAAQNSDCFSLWQEGSLIAPHDWKCTGILTVEGGAVLAGKLEHIQHLKERHVKALTLTWNGSCEVGDGAMVPRPKGLTDFGRKAIPALEEAGILVDVSHASDPLFYDVAALAKKPIIATHSNARQICSHPRNLTDEQFAFIRDRGGLVGLNLHRWFVREDGQATLDDLFRHVYHFLSLGGEETLCLGTDFDGADVVPEIKNLTEMTHLYDYFCKMRLPEDIIDRIFYKNGKDFMDSL